MLGGNRHHPSRDAATCAYLSQLAAAPPATGANRKTALLGLAVDGKTLRVRHEVACVEWITVVEEVPVW